MDFSPYLPYVPHALGAVGVVWLLWVNRSAIGKFIPSLPSGGGAATDPMDDEHYRLCAYACMRKYLRKYLRNNPGSSDAETRKAIAALDTEVLPCLLSDEYE